MQTLLSRLGNAARSIPNEALLVSFALLRALFELPFPLSGGDALRKWMWARLIYHGWSPSQAIWGGWDHHASRLALNVPALLTQYLFGDAPWVYYVAPLALSTAALLIVYRLALRLGSPTFALWAAAGYAWFLPIRHASQLMPDGLSSPYVLGAVLCLVRVKEASSPKGRAGFAIGAGLCMMLAELSKEPNLFFMPGLCVALWLLTRCWRLPFAFAGTLGVCMLVELWIYRTAFDDYPLGRLSVMADKHLGNARVSQEIDGLWGLVERLGPTFEGFWGGALALFLIASLFCLARFKRLPPVIQLLVSGGLGFFLLHAFGVRSFDPLLPWQRALPRYVAVMYPFIWLVLAWLAAEAVRRLPDVPAWLRPRWAAVVAMGLALAFSAFARFPGWHEHPLVELARMNRLAKAGLAEGLPVVARHPKKYSVQSFQALFWDGFDEPHYVARRKLYPLRSIPFRGSHVWWMVDPARERVDRRTAKSAFSRWRKDNREVLVVRHERDLELARRGFREL